jgi:hypothetical protein
MIGERAVVEEHRLLALAHGQIGAVLDLVILHRHAPGELSGLFNPFDDVDELLGKDTHVEIPVRCMGQKPRRATIAKGASLPRAQER